MKTVTKITKEVTKEVKKTELNSIKSKSSKKKCHIRYGADFCGLGTLGIGLQIFGEDPLNTVSFESMFSCDCARFAKKFATYTQPPRRWDDDIVTRNLDELKKGLGCHSIGLYTFTAPCQGLSQAGLQRGASDPRTRLFFQSILVIEKIEPKSFVSENVWTLASHAKFKKFFDFLITKLQAAGARHGGYKVEWRILNSKHYVPQNRPRLYITGVRKDLVKKNTRGVPLFPVPPSEPNFKLKDVIVPLLGAKWKPAPPRAQANDYKNVMAAYKSIPTINPFLVPVVVDMKSSPAFSSHRVGECPALTKTRAAGFGYWASTKGGPLEVKEMCMLQGFKPKHLPWAEAGLKESAIAGALGNGQSLNLVMDLVPHVLFHSGQITYEQFEAMKVVAAKYNPCQP